MTEKTFYIIDGSACIYRAYYAIRNLSTSQGVPTNAVYGFIQMLLKIIKGKKPDYLALAFDTKGPTFRHVAYPEYKAHRPAMPDDLAAQISSIHRAVAAFGITSLSQEGIEADDIIGTWARKGEAAGLMVTIVSGDKDFFQLISPHVRMYDTLKEKIYTEADIQAKFGVPPSRIIEIMGLTGDAVDNVPGVRGIGPKTAKDLICQFGTIEELLARRNDVKKESARKALEEQQDFARLSRELVTIRTDCPIDFRLEQFQTRSPDLNLLLPFLRELEFSSLLKEFSGSLDSASSDAESAALPPVRNTLPIMPLIDVSQLALALPDIASGGSVALALASEEQGTRLVLGVAPKGVAPFCVALDLENLPSLVRNMLASPHFLKVGHDMKPTLSFLKKKGVHGTGPLFDTHIAAWLLDPSRRDYALETVAQSHLNVTLAREQPGEDKGSAVSFGEVSALLALEEPIRARLCAASLYSLFTQMELPLIDVLIEMEQTGVKIDRTLLEQISQELEQTLAHRTTQIYALAGQEFNINSPKQLAHILFDVLGLAPFKKTKTGYSTDEEVLTHLAFQHDLPAQILRQRQEVKLKSTYVDPLLQRASQGRGRVHTTFNQAQTATGRLSSSDPNLQNIPIRGEGGERLREAFIVEEGCRLLCADYNQIELRILAHLSEDPALVSAFCKGEDIHAQTAMSIFHLPQEAITKEMRRVGKTVNFGIIYGISPFGLASQLGIAPSEAKRYIDLYFAHYEGVKRFIETTIQDAGQKGYVCTLFDRRRAIPELANRNKKIQEAGERLAVNTVIQGSAADIIKRAMIDIFSWMKVSGCCSRMILQVHDELLFEAPEDEAALMQKTIISFMEAATTLCVPLKVDVGSGLNWWAAKQ